MTTVRSKTGQRSRTPTSTAAHKLLRSVFGFSAFRDGQAEIIAAILAGRDVLAIMPTGSGKSLCYQLPALLRDGLTIVVSPLIALMRNQVAQLRSYGVAAAALNSANDFSENRDIAEQIARGELRLAYIAPERLAKPEMVAMLRGAKPAMLAVDEAHCISQWGHDFRPDYMNLAALRDALGIAQTVAFTATADEATRGDVASRLFAAPPEMFVHGFDRPNLRLAMSPRRDGRGQLLRFIGSASRRQRHRVLQLAQGDGGARGLPARRRASMRSPITPAWSPTTGRATRTRSCRRTAW